MPGRTVHARLGGEDPRDNWLALGDRPSPEAGRRSGATMPRHHAGARAAWLATGGRAGRRSSTHDYRVPEAFTHRKPLSESLSRDDVYFCFANLSVMRS